MKKISFLQLAAFAAPGAPLAAISVPTIVFLPIYYSEALHLDIGLVGALFVAGRVFDILLDPLFGVLQDRTRTRIGQRRAWMIFVTPILMAAAWVAFIGLQPGAPLLLVALVIMALFANYAAMVIAHLGWAGEIEPDYHARTRILGAVQIASTIGQVGVLAVPAIVTATGLGTFADAIHAMGWTIIIALPITMAACALFVREPRAPPHPPLTLKAAFIALRDNRELRRVLAPDFLVGVTQGMAGALFLFFFRYKLGLEREAQALLLLYFAAGLAGVPLWIFLGRKLGKHRALQVGAIWWALALAIVPFTPSGNLLIGAAVLLLAGIAQSAGTLMTRAMLADVVDDDQVRTGAQRSGLFFGLLLTTTKIGLALGPASLILLAPFGFDPDLGANNSPSAMNALTALFAGAPFLLNLLIAFSVLNYGLDARRQNALREEIAARASSSPAESQ